MVLIRLLSKTGRIKKLMGWVLISIVRLSLVITELNNIRGIWADAFFRRYIPKLSVQHTTGIRI